MPNCPSAPVVSRPFLNVEKKTSPDVLITTIQEANVVRGGSKAICRSQLTVGKSSFGMVEGGRNLVLQQPTVVSLISGEI